MAKSFNAQMKGRFARITASYQAANELVHETGMLILRHANEHKDCSMAQGLVMAMPASVRREQLILWFKLYSPIVVKNDDAWKSQMQPENLKNGAKNSLFVPFNIEEADANPFYRLAEKNKEATPALDEEGILKLISRLATQLDKKVTDGDVRLDLVESAQAAAAQLRKIKIVASKPANNNEEPAKPAANG